MDWYKVALITAFTVLLQCDLHQADTCKNRKTTIQIKVPGKTNINIKFPSNTDPIKFVPYPSEQNKNNDCYICTGFRCRRCTAVDSKSPSSPTTQSNAVRTNIVIDLRRKDSEPQKGTNTSDQSASTTNNSSTGGITKKDGTVVIVQDSTAAASVSDAASSNTGNNGGQTAASASSSVAVSNTDLIASFDQNAPGDKSNSNTEDIYVQDDSQSMAGSYAVSNVDSQTTASDKDVTVVTNPPTPPTPISVTSNKNQSTLSTVTETFSASDGKTISNLGNGGNLNSAESVGSSKGNVETVSYNGGDTLSQPGAIFTAAATTNRGRKHVTSETTDDSDSLLDW